MPPSVISSVIRSVDHDAETGVLTVRFVTGRVYRYFAVPQSAARALRAAASQGRYFNAHIRGRYPYEEVTAPRAA